MSKSKTKPEPSIEKLTGDNLPAEVQELFRQYHKKIAAGRANYGKADKLLEQILIRCAPGASVLIEGTGKRPPEILTLVDRFEEKNAVWTGASCKRMAIEAKEVKPQDRKPSEKPAE